MRDRRTDVLLTLSLLFAVVLWGGNNTGTKVIVGSWPPIWTGASRFCAAGLLMLIVLKSSSWLGASSPLTPSLRRRLWWRGGLSLAVYIVTFNSALRFTAASHVALYLGAAPVWALLWEAPNLRSTRTIQRYSAAALALAGVFILFLPSLKTGKTNWIGEILGLAASLLWTNYGRQCRTLGTHLSGAEIGAHTMWRAGLLLMPLAGVEFALAHHGLVWETKVLLIQGYCILFGGVAAFGIWNNALRSWPASQVLLFNNLIPLSTMTWAHLWLREPVTPTFGLAMSFIIVGVVLGQTNWQKIIQTRSP
jgi:drug/metabolite transporter (DMT)-like permease